MNAFIRSYIFSKNFECDSRLSKQGFRILLALETKQVGMNNFAVEEATKD